MLVAKHSENSSTKQRAMSKESEAARLEAEAAVRELIAEGVRGLSDGLLGKTPDGGAGYAKHPNYWKEYRRGQEKRAERAS